MRNPFHSEASAFHFLWVVIVCAAIVVAGWTQYLWLGVAFLCVEVLGLGWWMFMTGSRERPIRQAPAPHPAGRRRVLVIANETVGGGVLLDEVRSRCDGARAEVLVVCPALASPLKHWVSDEDGARAAAQARLDASLAAMHEAGIDARGEIGDGDPLQAIEDAIRTFAPDEMIISTHPPERSNWLERGVVEAARERFALPVAHVVGEGEPAGRPS